MADGPLFLSALVFGSIHLAAVIASWGSLPAPLALSYVACSVTSALNHSLSSRTLVWADRAAVVAGIAADSIDSGRFVPPFWTSMAAVLYVSSKGLSRAPRTALHAVAHACVTRGHLNRAAASL